MAEMGDAEKEPLTWITSRPAVPLAILFFAGILLHAQFGLHPRALLLSISILAMGAAFTLGQGRRGGRREWGGVCTLFLSLAVLLIGGALAARSRYSYPANHIGLFAGDDPHLAQVELRLLDEPRILASSNQMRPLPPRQMATAEILQIKTWNGWIPCVGETVLQIDQPHPDLKVGQIVRVLGMLQRPAAAMNPGQFDWSAYYRQQRVLATITVNRVSNISIVGVARVSPLDWLRIKTRRLLCDGFSPNRATEAALLRAMLLGDRDPQTRDVQEEFQQLGVGYQLSVSGLHVAMLAATVLWLCRFLCFRPRTSLLVATCFVVLYGLIALPSHSGARSVILCIAIALATLARRPADNFQILSLALLAIIAWHPLDVYSIGFQLSFMAALALAVFTPRVEQFLISRRDPDKVAAGHLIKRTRMQMVFAPLAATAVRCLEIAVIVWLATLPLVAMTFGQMNPWVFLMGLPLLVAVYLALVIGVMKILITFAFPILAGLWATIAAWPVELIRWMVDLLARLPGSKVPLTAPPLWMVIAYYVLLCAPLIPRVPLFTGRRRWCVRCGPLAGVAAVLAIPLFPAPRHPMAPVRELRITLLSLGAGQCAVVEPPDGEVLLLDAGSASITDLTRKIIGPFLRSEGRHGVDRIFLSHGDFDHICAAGEIAGAFGVHEVFISPHFRRNAVGNVPDEALLAALDKLNLSPHLLSEGNHLNLGAGAGADVLWPPPTGKWNSNNAGIVMRVTYAGRTILFPADIQDPAFEGVLKHPEQLAADVLVAPHHGSSETLTPAFLKAVHPAAIVSSNAWRLTSKQRRFDAIAGGTPLYRTSKSGAITITVSDSGLIHISTFTGK